MDNKINIEELENIILFLLSKVKENIGNEIELNNDYYWDISDNEIYSPYEEPQNITLGQLSHDIEEIQRVTLCDDVIIYDLKRLSSIIKAIGIENPTAF